MSKIIVMQDNKNFRNTIQNEQFITKMENRGVFGLV